MAVLPLAFVLVMCTDAVADLPRSATNLEAVHGLMQAAFPELRGHHLLVNVGIDTTFDNDWHIGGPVGFVVRRRNEEFHYAKTDVEQESQLLGGFVGIAVRGNEAEIDHAVFSGRHVHQRECREFKELSQQNLAWTEQDVAAELAGRGAKYGPNRREPFIDTLALDRLTPVLGPIKASEIKFVWRQGFRDHDSRDITLPMWVVFVQATEVQRCYLLTFEPFDGRLTRILQQQDCSRQQPTGLDNGM